MSTLKYGGVCHLHAAAHLPAVVIKLTGKLNLNLLYRYIVHYLPYLVVPYSTYLSS